MLKRGLLSVTAALFFFISACFNAEGFRSLPDEKKSSRFAGHQSKGFRVMQTGSEDTSLSMSSLLSGAADVDNRKKSEHHIVLFLGYGFSESEKKQVLIDALKGTYGLSDDGGLISVLTYPEDVSVSGRVRMSVLTAKVKELHAQKALTGFISAGAPQGTHTVLAALQDAGINIPVFSLFPQDDVLGTEAGSSLVFDYRPAALQDKSAGEVAAQEESDYEYAGKYDLVLIPLIQAVLYWDRIKNDEMLIPALRTEFFRQTGCNLIMYNDPVTGLRAKNHYVLTDAPKDKR